MCQCFCIFCTFYFHYVYAMMPCCYDYGSTRMLLKFQIFSFKGGKKRKWIVKSPKCEFVAVITQVVVKSLAIYGTQIDSWVSYLDTVKACMCLFLFYNFFSFSCILFKVCTVFFFFFTVLYENELFCRMENLMFPKFYHFKLKLPKPVMGQHFYIGHIILMTLEKKSSHLKLTLRSFSFRWQ